MDFGERILFVLSQPIPFTLEKQQLFLWAMLPNSNPANQLVRPSLLNALARRQAFVR